MDSNISNKSKNILKVATVFSGIGAPEQALKRMDIPHEIVFACDNGERMIDVDYEQEFNNISNLASPEEKSRYVDGLYSSNTRKTNFVQISYLANYDPDYYFQDVKLLDGKDFKNSVDLFVGGSPCQSFSIAGKRGGFVDTRGTLFYEYCRLIKELQPEVFIYENVFNVIKHDKGKTWETMSNVFTELGYHWDFRILNAKDYGIPQSRKRLFVVGFKDEKYFNNFFFPETKDLKTDMQYYLEDNCAIGKMQSVDGVLTKIGRKKGEPDEVNYLSENVKKYVLSPGTKNFYHPNAKIDLKIARALLSTMNNCHRASVDNYVTTHGRIRKLSNREALRLMGFPDDFKINVSRAQIYKQAGNSIVVDVVMSLYDSIFDTGVFNGKNK